MTDAEKTAACRAALPDEPIYRTLQDYQSAPYNAWLQVTDEQPISGLHATLKWAPRLGGTDYGVKFIGYMREDGAGYMEPTDDGRWWVTFTHPMGCGRTGWHHHAFGTYASAETAAMAFDVVYELERLAGNTDRMTGRETVTTGTGRPSPPSQDHTKGD